MQEREEQLWEYIRALQSRIDRLVEADEVRLGRIRKLEEDRAILRERLADARARLKRRRFWRSRPAETAEQEETPVSSAGPDVPTLEVPGVGMITEPCVREGSPRRSLEVATVLDTISAAAFAPEFHTRPVSAKRWRDDVADQAPDLLLVESAYAGVDGSWATRIARFGGPSDQLRDLVGWCRSKEIPTVFWNKEDPINFEWFIESARLFDFVFTVDGDQIDRYKIELRHEQVALLQFFAQPALHYPGPDEDRAGDVAFAGSFYAAKHPQRREQIETVLDPARKFGLHIFDRHGTTDDERFRWPERYRGHIVGSLSYLQTVEAYRRYKVFLNVNTVTRSPTMCARRIFELAACGTPIVSGQADSIAELENRGVLKVVRSPEETETAVERLLRDSEERRGLVARGLDWVADGNTAEDRVDTILRAVSG